MLEDMVDGLMAGHVEALGDEYDAGCVLAPAFGAEPLPLRRRAVMRALQLMLGRDARVETASVEAVLAAFDEEAMLPLTSTRPTKRACCGAIGRCA